MAAAPINKPIIAVAALVVVLAGAGAYYLRHRAVPLPTEPAPAANTAPAEPEIAHPLPADASAAALPSLADSDAPLREALGQIAGADAVKNYLMPENLIRRLVLTIDNLPRQKVAVERRPTPAIGAPFVAEGDELHATLDRQNFERYKPMVAVIGKLDMQRLPAVYFGFYPLLPQSYKNLRYPPGS